MLRTMTAMLATALCVAIHAAPSVAAPSSDSLDVPGSPSSEARFHRELRALHARQAHVLDSLRQQWKDLPPKEQLERRRELRERMRAEWKALEEQYRREERKEERRRWNDARELREQNRQERRLERRDEKREERRDRRQGRDNGEGNSAKGG